MGLDARLFGSNIARRTSVLFYGLRFPHIPYHLRPPHPGPLLAGCTLTHPSSSFYDTHGEFISSLIESVEVRGQINSMISNQSDDDAQVLSRELRTAEWGQPNCVR